jgi:hypothetical protein
MTAMHDLSRPLTLLASARWAPSAEISGLIAALERQPPESRVFIISDTPVRLWESMVPDVECEVTCLSVSNLRKRQPQLHFSKRP